ncbi:L,D-transpeptidase family protein [Altericroceibacterium endophyticum]|uniref:L,D-transpeptidase family protein n=1 Tax=Altericroceibacterium endophyticum TaxID=1808508 RepID=A0A6I4T901_9SPHN|nr:L,D-transpeptidase family protein [Altericroceibacterium endophyticum]MXO66611.1 L,D-transpeptidase family protein [Altericroceibacterium endophyticum]
MTLIVKWIGGATAAILLALLAVMFLGHSLSSAQSDAEMMAQPAKAAGSATASADGSAPAPATNNPSVQRADTSTEGAATSVDVELDSPPAPALAAKKAASPFVIKHIMPIDGPLRYGEWHWDETGAPADGPLVMTVDLDARVLSVFRGGYEIGATAVLLGTQDHPTPLGTFPILEKNRDNVSSLYDAPMPYTLRLTWDGISIHGSQVENGYASHGCIGTPKPFAAKLFALASKGDRVIITRGKMAGVGDLLIES